MADIFETTVICDTCRQETVKGHTIKEGFQIRMWQCLRCHKEWLHPSDVEEFRRFQELRRKTYHVKLRLVGNSYTVSIPREIIAFQEEMQKEINTMINLSLDEPEKMTLYFSKRIERLME